MQHWLLSWIPKYLDGRSPPDDPETFARRETQLRQRLERLTQEVEVMQRSGADEARPE